jgi:hypothetical protein
MTADAGGSITATLRAAVAAGLNVWPPAEDGSKRPVARPLYVGPDGRPTLRRTGQPLLDEQGKQRWGWEPAQYEPVTPELLQELYLDGRRTGIGLICGYGDLELLEFDGDLLDPFTEAAEQAGLAALWERVCSGYLEETPGGGWHVFWRCSAAGGNTVLARRPAGDRTEVLIETRGRGGYAIIAPSNGRVHPSGRAYRLARGGPATIAAITPAEREALLDLARSFDELPRARASDPPPADRSGWEVLPGDDFNARADWEADILAPAGWTFVCSRGDRHHYRRPGKDTGVSGNVRGDLFYCFSSSTPLDAGKAYTRFGAYAALHHGGDYRAAAAALAAAGYGVRREPPAGGHAPAPPSPGWPAPLGADAYYGITGEVVRTIEPATEADPAALLVTFLVMAGNCIGRGPHALAEADRHGLNLFAVIVGDTAKGRKGTSKGRLLDLFQRADPEWASTEHVVSGLSSGEGLIWAVRDRRGEDEGVADKRLLAVEAEFAATLKVLTREGNTLSPLVRLAWDTGNLRSLTKNSPAVATGAHISILAHITRDELLRHLTETEAGNGFANRFLFVLARRSRILPFGGEPPAYGALVSRLRAALEAARSVGRLGWAACGAARWEAVYPALTDGEPGLLGAVTARAEAQVLRLAALYAVLDGSSEIRAPHLAAALAVWRYCRDSAAAIFGDATGDHVADRIMEALRQEPEGLTRTDISALFARHVSQPRIDAALALLRRLGRASGERSQGRGRPVEVWRATALAR